MKVLIIDDEVWLLENLATILRFAGYTVLTAQNGLAGVRAAHEWMPDIIVCDIMMPELDGYGVLRELQSHLSTASIPFIFLTARSDHTHRRLGMNLGADDYLSKPFADDELLAAIQIRLEKRRGLELQQYQKFAEHLVHSHEAERQRLAALLRKEIGAELLNLELVLRLSERLPPDALRHSIGSLRALVERAANRAEEAAQELNPYLLEEAGLIPALEWCVSTLPTAVRFQYHGIRGRFVPRIEQGIYRIIQLSLRLATGPCAVTLWRENDALHLHIDFGDHQIDKDALMTTLVTLREYAEACQGQLDAQIEPPVSIYLLIPGAREQIAVAQAELIPHVPASASDARVRLSLDISDDHLRGVLAAYVRAQTPFQIAPTQPERLTAGVPADLAADPWVVLTDMPEAITPARPTVFLTVHDDPAHIGAILRRGARSVVLKRATASDLVEAVQAAVAGKLFVSPDAHFDLACLTRAEESGAAFDLAQVLTSREIEILNLILADKSHAEIGADLMISPRTVEKHRANLMQKLGLRTHTELILFAVRQGLLSG